VKCLELYISSTGLFTLILYLGTDSFRPSYILIPILSGSITLISDLTPIQITALHDILPIVEDLIKICLLLRRLPSNFGWGYFNVAL
jgi:hypothetical protein